MTLRITTRDGKVLEVSQDIAKMSKVIANAIESNEPEEDASLTLPEINEKEMKIIIEYCKHHKFEKVESDIEKPLKSKDPAKFIVDSYDRSLMNKLDLDGKSALLSAANAIDCTALFELCCASVAAFFKG